MMKKIGETYDPHWPSWSTDNKMRPMNESRLLEVLESRREEIFRNCPVLWIHVAFDTVIGWLKRAETIHGMSEEKAKKKFGQGVWHRILSRLLRPCERHTRFYRDTHVLFCCSSASLPFWQKPHPTDNEKKVCFACSCSLSEGAFKLSVWGGNAAMFGRPMRA